MTKKISNIKSEEKGLSGGEKKEESMPRHGKFVIEPPIRRNGTREGELVSFEVVVSSENESIFAPETFLTPKNIDNFVPKAGAAQKAAKRLQDMGFKILYIGTFSISGEAPKDLWESTFNTEVKKDTMPISYTHPEAGERAFLSHVAGAPFEIPDKLTDVVERAYPQKPPTFFESPLPPIVPYQHLDVPGDIAMILRADKVNRNGIKGKDILVAMLDTGFYYHKFYESQGYNYNRTVADDAVDEEKDEIGHGTAEAANIFSVAPDVTFMGIKMGLNATLAFKMAVDFNPKVISCSWGWDINQPTLPNWLRPLEAEIIYAVKQLGITVVFSAGNGHYSFPGQMPDVISVGGVYAQKSISGRDFDLKASDYASSFPSPVYPGRNVPDVCGLVGMLPNGIYIMLPLQPDCEIDRDLAGNEFPKGDMTEPDDGWAVISGTSAAAPQIAGVCALLKQVKPSLTPNQIKQILINTARDVKKGTSNPRTGGNRAGRGFDSATGAGLVDTYKACKLAPSFGR